MFLDKKILGRMMKQAYKTGISLAMENGWLFIQGAYWKLNIRKDFIPKETLGLIISLVGDLPEEGQRFTATKEGNQMEIGRPMNIEPTEYGRSDLEITDLIIVDSTGIPLRILQDPGSGEMFTVKEVIVAIIDMGAVEESRGEFMMSPIRYKQNEILMENNVCRFSAAFARPKSEVMMQRLKGVDLIIGAETDEKED